MAATKLDEFVEVAREQGLTAVLAVYDGEELVGSVNLSADPYRDGADQAVGLAVRGLRRREGA